MEPLQLKFRGCMVGALLGDCLGCPFEFQRGIKYAVFIKKIEIFLKDKLENEKEVSSSNTLLHTDDTAMAKSVAQSLIENKSFNAKDLARKFGNEYFDDPHTDVRNYGDHVSHIFENLRMSEDVFEAARNQFNGTGSFGNGGAMRVAPVSLFTYHQDFKTTAELAKNSALLTHFHPDGYNGAILQSLAVKLALQIGQENRPIIPAEFIDSLIDQMNQIEEEPKFYTNRLPLVKELLKNVKATPNIVAAKLGNGVSAPKSVPTAIYAFLRSMEPIPDFETSNPFVRTLFLTFAFGGDTDTIGTMAGAISGAYHGIEMIPESLQVNCEGLENAIRQADELYKIIQK